MENGKWKMENSRTSGFTLVEMLVTFAVLASISAISAVSFVTYNKSQTLSNTTKDIQQMLSVAKSRTQSQVKPADCDERSLVGYEFRVCGGEISCLTGADGGEYELVGVCAGLDGGTPEFVPAIPQTGLPVKKLPQGITFDPTSLGVAYKFRVLTGGVTGTGKIILHGPDNVTKTITVDKQGNIGDED